VETSDFAPLFGKVHNAFSSMYLIYEKIKVQLFVSYDIQYAIAHIFILKYFLFTFGTFAENLPLMPIIRISLMSTTLSNYIPLTSLPYL
jgi:hypothetical protein